jgi:hypothetical protein
MSEQDEIEKADVWRFEALGRSSKLWHRYAQALLVSATLLWEHVEAAPEEPERTNRRFEYWPIASMLAGMALESMAKAVQIRQNPVLVTEGKWTLKEHDLEKLVAGAGLSVAPAEKSLLFQFTGFVRWAGKYPVPLEWRGLALTVKEPGVAGTPPGTIMRGDDRDLTIQIFKRLEELLGNLTSNQPPSDKDRGRE